MNNFSGGAAFATSVATRRSPACSSARTARARSEATARRRASVAMAATVTDMVEEQTEHEHGRPVERTQRRQEVPVERLNDHDSDREREQDPGDAGDGQDDQQEQGAGEHGGHVIPRGREHNSSQGERGQADDDSQGDLSP